MKRTIICFTKIGKTKSVSTKLSKQNAIRIRFSGRAALFKEKFSEWRLKVLHSKTLLTKLSKALNTREKLAKLANVSQGTILPL